MKTAMALGLLAAANLSAADLPQRTHDFRIQPKMEMLRPGEVRPQGWLRDWCESARKGYVSRLDEVHSAFRRAWNGEFHPRGQYLKWTDKSKGSWPTEGGAYWFEGLVRLAWALDDAELKAFATKRLTPLLEGMNPNAIGFVYWMDRRDPEQLREVARADHGYIMGSTGRSTRFMLAYYEATGDERALQALKWCLDDPWPYFYGNPVSIPSGGADTWRYCGDAKIAAALENFRTNYPAMSEKKWPSLMFGKAPVPEDIRLRQRFVLEKNKDWEARLQHGVLTYESLYSFLKLAQWSGDYKLFDDVRAWFDFIDKHAMQVHGVPVADEQWGHPGAERGTETCVVAGYILQAAAMMGATGEGTFGDRAERAFFNAGAGCVARDWMHHVYMQAPNRTTAEGNFCRGKNWRGGIFRNLHWPLCCTAALTRILPGYVQWMWMKPSAGGLAATLYGPNTLVSDVNGTPVVIETKTAYPFEESVEMSVRPQGEVRFPLSLRMPDWCKEPELTVNGEKPEFAVRDGFAVVDRVWRAGDRVSLRFPMTPAVVRTNDLGQGGKPYGSLTLGPLLFAYALPEKDENTPLPEAKTDWKVDSSKILDGCKVVRGPMPEFWGWQADAPLKLSVTAEGGQPLELVPYGCAKLRISMFPDVAADATPLEPTGTIDVKVPSASMKKDVPAVVILPKGYATDPLRRWPVVYLLHGAGDDESHARKPPFATLAETYGVIVVCPRATSTWWFDSPVDPAYRYETFMTKELVPWVDATYRTAADRGHRALVGNSMGGHGACFLGMRHKDMFGAVGNIFGGVELLPYGNRWKLADRLGDPVTCEKNWRDLCVLKQAETLKDGELELFTAVGTNDTFIKPNRKLHELLVRNGVQHYYLERIGGHSPEFWTEMYPLMFRFIDNYFKTGKGRP